MPRTTENFKPHIEDVLHNERMSIKSAQTMPKWWEKTLQGNKLSAPLHGSTL